mgnify:CR=1 FL=1
MTPRNHLPDDLWMDHAGGGAARGVEGLVTSHRVLCPACRRRVAELEVLGGAVLDGVPPAALDTGLLDGIMGRLDEGEPPWLQDRNATNGIVVEGRASDPFAHHGLHVIDEHETDLAAAIQCDRDLGDDEIRNEAAERKEGIDVPFPRAVYQEVRAALLQLY